MDPQKASRLLCKIRQLTGKQLESKLSLWNQLRSLATSTIDQRNKQTNQQTINRQTDKQTNKTKPNSQPNKQTNKCDHCNSTHPHEYESKQWYLCVHTKIARTYTCWLTPPKYDDSQVTWSIPTYETSPSMKIRHLMMFPFNAPLNSGISTDHISSAQELLEDTSPVGTSKELSRGTGEFLDLGNPRTFRGRLWENHPTTKWTMAMSNYQRVIALYYIRKIEDCEQNNYCWNTLEFRADCPETFCSSLEFQVCCVMLCVSAICGQYHCWWFRTPCGSLHFSVHASLVQGGNIPQNLLEPKVIWVRVCALVHCIWTINTVTGAKLPGKTKWTMWLSLTNM